MENINLCNTIEKLKKNVVMIKSYNKTKWKVIYSEQYGTGFFFKKNYILTNYHIVENSKKIEVKNYFHDEFKIAQIVGFDKYKDICVLKVSGFNSNLLNQSSENLREGQIVLTMGMPHGLDYTSAIGIISSLNHSIRLEDNSIIEDVIQLDMNLHPGNSGSPLVNQYGVIIGMNTLTLTKHNNISFALKIDYVLNIVDNLMKR